MVVKHKNPKNRNTLCHSSTKSVRPLLTGLSAIALCVSSSFAQETTEQTSESQSKQQDDSQVVEVIQVQGIRKSFETSQDLKRYADTFVDAITAADIGALPDRSVSEALQRIPGVNIIRFSGPNDPNRFSVEGSGVVIRGLPFVRSELNGRDVFGAAPGGVLGFEDVSPELLGSVQVFKNQSADLIEGGLAGTIDLRTRLPFDQEGQLISFSAESNYSDLADEFTPTFSALYSNNWQTDVGRIGFLGNISYNELQSRADGTQIFDYDPVVLDGETFYIPAGIGIRQQNFQRERYGIAAAAQWESTDKKWLASVQYLRSDAAVDQDEFTGETAADGAVQGQSRENFDRSDFVFDDNNVFTSGTISDNSQWRGPNGTAELIGQQDGSNGGQQLFHRRNRFEDDLTSDYSVSLKYSPNDLLRFNFEAQYLEADSQVVDLQVFTSAFAAVRVGEEVNGVPEVSFVPPTGQDSSFFADPSNFFTRASLGHVVDNEADAFSLRGDVEYDFNSDGWLSSVRAGVRYNEQDTTIRQSDFNWGAVSEVWTGRDINGTAFGPEGSGDFNDVESVLLLQGNSSAALNAATDGLFSNFGFGDFQRGTNTGIESLPFFSGPLGNDFNGFQSTIFNLLNAVGGSPAGSASSGGQFVPLSFRTLETDPSRFETVLPGSPFLLSEIGNVARDTFAAYVRFDYSVDSLFGSDVTLDGNFGMRYVRTDRVVDTFVLRPGFTALFPNANLCDPDDPETIDRIANDPDFSLPGICSQDVAALRDDFGNGSLVTDQVQLNYDFFLPSFNAKLGVSDDQIVRFAFSRTISRPGADQLNERVRIGTLPDINNGAGVPSTFGGLSGFQTGNANLLPQISSNFDLSWEWYFNTTGSVTLSGFYKDISDPIIAGSLSVDIANGAAQVLRPTDVNGDQGGTLQGLEIAYQQFYDFLPGWLSGFGTQFNYTYIDAELPPPNVPDILVTGGAADDPQVAFFPNNRSIFPRVSRHNMNAIALYEKGKIQARMAYNWRSEFLVTARNVIFPFASVFQPATGQLDASVFYQVNDKIKVGIQGVNLTDDITLTQDAISDDGLRGPASFFRNDRRYTFIVRATF
jgi:TonB-dependent receptor